MNKRAQQTMGMPFGIIFAIILIVVFIVIAFIAIGSFLDIGRSTSVGTFYTDLQGAVDGAWSSQAGESLFKMDLPSGIKIICFANLSAPHNAFPIEYNQIEIYGGHEANTFLVPPENSQSMPWKQINHINITKITKDKNPYCVNASEDLLIKKDFYDKFVVIE
ncbi:MAG: hypothetical protein NUV97_00530 [archaeon]|nr:hypothetical protein [archaeon]